MDHYRDYGQDKELAKQFLRDYAELDEEGTAQSKYGPIMTQLANRESIHMLILLADVEKFNQDLYEQIIKNTCRYVQIFYEALDELLPSYKTREVESVDPMDVFIEQRINVAERNMNRGQPQAEFSQNQNRNVNIDIDGVHPPDLIRRVEISFKPPTLMDIPIREVKAKYVGKLVTIRGIVTRATDVKPKVTIVTYTCDQCGCESFQPVKGQEFTPLSVCSSGVCRANKTLGRLTMQTRGSKFVKFQEIKLQEHTDQVPTGHIPRMVTILIHGELTRQCGPGDHVSVSGVFLTLEKSGFRMRSGGLAADTYIDAHYITRMNKTDESEFSIDAMSLEEAHALVSGDGSGFLSKLSSSIAPEIFGHEELKKALLLLLVGGVDRNPNGMKIRGNINICLTGDPGVAKSQLLVFIDRLASRCQYTTGRGSSGVGLTAAVLKDPITNELVLEGGALVLADQGICCIDEFDKMMESDRTAIHEVMEQQTVSIAKAGIMTSLNARTSILAAANPAYGRFDVSKLLTENLQLPPALLSRFDLLWLIRDEPTMEKDKDLAQHVTRIHRFPADQIENNEDTIDMKTMRRYINLCKTKNPKVPEELTDRLVDIYLGIRATKRLDDDSLFTSPRSLLAIIRLTTAFARLRLADVVEEADVDAAVDLYNASRESVQKARRKDASIEMYIIQLIDDLSKDQDGCKRIELQRIYEEAYQLSGQYTKDQVDVALKNLNEADTIAFEDDNTILRV